MVPLVHPAHARRGSAGPWRPTCRGWSSFCAFGSSLRPGRAGSPQRACFGRSSTRERGHRTPAQWYTLVCCNEDRTGGRTEAKHFQTARRRSSWAARLKTEPATTRDSEADRLDRTTARPHIMIGVLRNGYGRTVCCSRRAVRFSTQWRARRRAEFHQKPGRAHSGLSNAPQRCRPLHGTQLRRRGGRRAVIRLSPRLVQIPRCVHSPDPWRLSAVLCVEVVRSIGFFVSSLVDEPAEPKDSAILN